MQLILKPLPVADEISLFIPHTLKLESALLYESALLNFDLQKCDTAYYIYCSYLIMLMYKNIFGKLRICIAQDNGFILLRPLNNNGVKAKMGQQLPIQSFVAPIAPPQAPPCTRLRVQENTIKQKNIAKPHRHKRR